MFPVDPRPNPLNLEPLDCVTLSLVRSRGLAYGGARPAGLGEAGRPGILPKLAPESKTHPKLVELVRIKQNMNET